MSATWLLLEAHKLCKQVIDRQYEQRPDLEARYGPAGRAKCEEDFERHLQYLLEALERREPALFSSYVIWCHKLLLGLGFPPDDLVLNLTLLGDVLKRHPEGHDASRIVRDAVENLGDGLLADGPLNGAEVPPEQALAYLEKLLAFDRVGAERLVEEALAAGTDLESVYMDIFQPALREVGRRWHESEVSVATEHYCTAVTETLMSRIAPGAKPEVATNGHAVFSCVGDEFHQLGVRMLSDLAEVDGWRARYLGANMPTSSLVGSLEREPPKVLALSVTYTPNLKRADEIIRAVRASPALADVKVLVGGYPFSLGDNLWVRMGADGTAADARAGRRLLQQVAD